MSEEKRLSLSFGNFSFEIVGYDEPFTVMAKVFDLVIKTSKEAPWLVGEDMADSGTGRRRFAAALNENARTFDLDIAEVDGRFVVTPPDAEKSEENLLPGATPEPSARAPLHLSVEAAPAEEPAEPELAAEAPAESQPEEAPADAGAPVNTVSEDEAREAETIEEDLADEVVEATELVASDEAAPGPEDQQAKSEVTEAVAEVVAAADEIHETAAEVTAEETADEAPSEANEAPSDEEAARSAPDTQAEESEPEPKPVLASRPAPKIVIDRARSQPHQRRKTQPAQKISATVTRSAETTLEEADTAAPFLLTSEFSAPRRPVDEKQVVDDDDENFLFSPESGDHAQEEQEEAPLALSGEDRIAEPKEATRKKRRGPLGLGIFRRRKDDDDAENFVAEGHDEDSAFDRLRETAEAQLPKLEEPTLELSRKAPEPALFAVSDGKDLDDAASPAAFARQMGAQSLQDLLEASAAFVSIVDGKAKFSRRDVMLALNDIGLDKEYTPEARLKSFRKLLTSGAIVRAEDGMFAISHATRFGYETQLRSNG